MGPAFRPDCRFAKLLGAYALALLVGCSSGIPEILQGVTAGGGYWGACPRPHEEQDRPLAISPELNARLSSRFPPGTAETTLTNALAGMGFRPSGSCDEDRTIRSLRFDKRGSGLVDVTAVVYWQADSQGKILWTKGFVAYTSL
jgi:hypothetical protein